MDRSAFLRAWEYLGYVRTYKWLAITSAALVGATFVLLVVLLGMFADLTVTRGIIPTFTDLNDAERERFCEQWNSWADEERRLAVAAWPFPETLQTEIAANASVSDRHTPLRWKVYVGKLLERRAGTDAAEQYRAKAYIPPGMIEETEAGRVDDPDRVQLGILAHVVRERDHPLSRVSGLLARCCSWSWHPSADGTPNRPYLLGLLISTVVLALLRGGLVLLMHYGASHATLDVVNRLRRLIYHHTHRLGSLTLSSGRNSEPVDVFIRRMDSLHDGLYTRLTISVREPVKITLLLLLAFVENLWLALATVCAAGLVWIISRQIAAVLRERGKAGARSALRQLALLEESLRMMRLVKGYLMDLFNQGRVERQLSEYSRAQMARFRGELVYRPLIVLFGTMAGAGLLFVAGVQILSERLEVSGLIVLATAIGSIYYPLDLWLAQRLSLIHI
ncbi:MAG: ABC transporter transmembrane domain-containing protein, partial [Gemmataceae bacterium]|nr:ABC transporter transmembrane domain-containing protein [Gemmataceae bacterium]